MTEQTPAPADSTEYAITTQWQITFGDQPNGTTLPTLVFDGDNAESNAYAVADILAATDIPQWQIRTRTVETQVTTVRNGPWITAEVASYDATREPAETLDEPL